MLDEVLTFAFLDDNPHDALDTLHDDGIRTLLRSLPRPDWSKEGIKASDWTINYLPVSNGVLCLHTEQKGRGEVLVCEDAGREGAVLYLFKVLLVIITVGEGNDPPDNIFLLIFFVFILF